MYRRLFGELLDYILVFLLILDTNTVYSSSSDKNFHIPENTGGSGGFSRGVEEGIKLDCDFLFLADDDAYAEPDVFEKLNRVYQNLMDKRISALCTAILNHGRYEIGHRCRIKKRLFRVKKVSIDEAFYQEEYFPVNTLSFVGVAVKKDAAVHAGIPKKEYFIWNDDVEYSLRLLKEGHIYCIPSSVMHHDVIYNQSSSWKEYYGTRNWIDLIRNHYPKRYFYFVVIERYIKQCSFLAFLFRKRDKAFRKMSLEAIQDAVNSRLGKNEKYLPTKRMIK